MKTSNEMFHLPQVLMTKASVTAFGRKCQCTGCTFLRHNKVRCGGEITHISVDEKFLCYNCATQSEGEVFEIVF